MILTIETLSVQPNQALQTYLSNVDRLEGGFSNPADKSDLLNEHAFIAWLQRMDNHAHGIDLPAGFVNQTLYFFKNDDRYVGIGKLRHRLTPALYVDGGHIAYGGVPHELRGHGIGTEMLHLLLIEAQQLAIQTPRATTTLNNFASQHILQATGFTQVGKNKKHLIFELQKKQL